VETNLQLWSNTINKLKNDLIASLSSPLKNIDDILIPSLSTMQVHLIKNEAFDQADESIRIEDNGQLATRISEGLFVHCARGRSEYISGKHQIRFQIERMQGNQWIFVGIISKNEHRKVIMYSTHSMFGWAGFNEVLYAGERLRRFNNYISDMIENDIVQLIIDCDERKIILKNERTKTIHTLCVDVNKCPFPWQLYVGLLLRNDRVRLLSPL
jgi:hypothetical protein